MNARPHSGKWHLYGRSPVKQYIDFCYKNIGKNCLYNGLDGPQILVVFAFLNYL